MGDCYRLAKPLPSVEKPKGEKLKVLVTGSAGEIGLYFSEHSAEKFDLRLGFHSEENRSKLEGFGEDFQLDVGDLDRCNEACRGMDVVVHLAADPSPEAEWDTLLPINIEGTYNIFKAAKAQGVRRVIYASSIHAVSGYERDRQVQANDPVNPGDLYGVTKCFGEALGRLYAEQEGVQCIAVRIGAFQPDSTATDPKQAGLVDAFVSHRDLTQLLQKAVEAEHLQWAIVHGLSDNTFNRMHLDTARELLGYEPQDNMAAMNPVTKDLPTHLTSHAAERA